MVGEMMEKEQEKIKEILDDGDCVEIETKIGKFHGKWWAFILYAGSITVCISLIAFVFKITGIIDALVSIFHN